MSFRKSVQYDNDPGKAIMLIKETFLPLGFRMLNSTDDYIELAAEDNLYKKSGLWPRQEESLVCITKISFSFIHNHLSVEAEFLRLDKQIRYTPVFAAILIITVMAAIDIRYYQMGQAFSLTFFLPIIALTACIAGVLALLPGLLMKQMATRAIDALLNNIYILNKSEIK